MVDDGTNAVRIPNRHVFVLDTFSRTPRRWATSSSRSSAPPATSPAAAPRGRARRRRPADRGNVIWNGPADWPLGVGEDPDGGCPVAGASCSPEQLARDNQINVREPNWRPRPAGASRAPAGRRRCRRRRGRAPVARPPSGHAGRLGRLARGLGAARARCSSLRCRRRHQQATRSALSPSTRRRPRGANGAPRTLGRTAPALHSPRAAGSPPTAKRSSLPRWPLAPCGADTCRRNGKGDADLLCRHLPSGVAAHSGRAGTRRCRPGPARATRRESAADAPLDLVRLLVRRAVDPVDQRLGGAAGGRWRTASKHHWSPALPASSQTLSPP